jgi:hypothetical protein
VAAPATIHVVATSVSRRGLLAAGAAVLLPAAASCARTQGTATPSLSMASPSPSTSGATPTASTATTTATLDPTPSPTPSGVSSAKVKKALRAYLDGRQGKYRVAVHDRRSGVTLHLASGEAEMLSTIKVVIAMAALRRAAEARRRLTDSETVLLGAMLRESDNDATNTVLAQLGSRAVEAEISALRLTRTVFQPQGNWWGWSTTIPEDLLLVVDALVDGTTDLGTSRERWLLRQMQSTVQWQRWGVARPPLRGDLVVSTKNGWGPAPGGYRVNSMGHVKGEGRDYSMAVLGSSPVGFTDGTATVSTLATMVHKALRQRLV